MDPIGSCGVVSTWAVVEFIRSRIEDFWYVKAFLLNGSYESVITIPM